MHDPDRPAWKTEDVKAIDDSIANLLKQMLLAIVGMFAAFSAAEWATTELFDEMVGAQSFVVRGVTFAVFGALAIYMTSARPIRAALVAQQGGDRVARTITAGAERAACVDQPAAGGLRDGRVRSRLVRGRRPGAGDDL